MLLLKLMTNDLLSLFIYSSSHTRTVTPSLAHEIKKQTGSMQCNGSDSSADAEHTTKPASLAHEKSSKSSRRVPFIVNDVCILC
jgi:hypothetical protein